MGGGGDFHGKIGEMMIVNGLCLVDHDLLGQDGIIWGKHISGHIIFNMENINGMIESMCPSSELLGL